MKRKAGSLVWARSLARIGQRAVKIGSQTWGQAVGQALKQAARKAPSKPARKKAAPKLVQAAATAPSSTAAAARQRAAAMRDAASGRWVAGVAVSNGTARRWRLYIPPRLPAGERPPLLVLLHGCGQDAAGFAAVTAMHRVADRGGFLVLFPEQDRLANPQGCWNWFETGRGDLPGRAQAEADAVLAAIDQVCLRRADRRRVVVAGLSAGAGLAALLALRHPQRLGGVVMHSGVPPGTAHSSLTALAAMRGRRGTAPIETSPGTSLPPLLVIHGSLDGVVSSRNARAAAEAWAAACGAAAGASRRVQRGQRHAMQVTDYRRPGRGGGVCATLAEVAGLRHAWSGGAAGLKFSDPQGPDASRLIWAFAQRQFRRVSN